MDGSTSLQDAILRAVDTLTSARIDTIQADKTVLVQINKCSNALQREYKVDYNGGVVTAYAQEGVSYSGGQQCYMLIPQGDMTKRKVLVGEAQARENDSNISFVASALSDYNLIGRNVILDDSKVQPASLHSYLKTEYKMLYSYDPLGDNEPRLGIDANELENNLKEAEAIMIEATFYTRLPKEHRVSKNGKYGLEFVLAFDDRDNVDENGVPVTKYYSYVIDSNNMTGNPFHYAIWNEQYQIYPIDLKDFKYISSILFFEQDFVEEDNAFQADDKLGWGADIFVKDIEFYGLKHISAQNGPYKLRLSLPDGNTFKTITDQAKLTVRGTFTKDNVTDLSDNAMFYWFQEDSRITTESPSDVYNAYGGAGWRLLSKKGTDCILEVYGNENRAYENYYKVVAVYKEQVILKDTFTIYNEASKRDLQIVSSLGNKFSFDRGVPELTCLVNGKVNGFEDGKAYAHPDEYYRFIWSKEDAAAGTMIFNETRDELQKEYDDLIAGGKFSYNDLSALRSRMNALAGVSWKKNILQYPIKGIEHSATFKCSVFLKDTIDGDEYSIGSASITLQNEEEATPNEYYIIIENGDQVFQYSESGVSPNDSRYTDPLKVKPLICHFYDPAGIEVNNKTYTVKWKVPLVNTMIVTPSTGMEVNNANGKREWYTSEIYPLDGWEVNGQKVSGIAQNYDYFALQNQVQCIVDYDGKTYTQYTNLTFTKIGENGTNGTDIVGKISPTYTRYDDTLLALEVIEGRPQFNSGQTMSQKVLDFNLYQRNEKLSIDSNDVRWTVSGGTSSNSKYLSVDDGIITYSIDNEVPGKFRNQIIRAQINWEDHDYYSFYPLPIIYYSRQPTYKIYIRNDETLKSVLYNADGRYPIYNKNQGVSLKLGDNGDIYRYIVWHVEGGMPTRITNGYELHPTTNPDLQLIHVKNSKDKQMKIEPSVRIYNDGEPVDELQPQLDDIWGSVTLSTEDKRNKTVEVMTQYRDGVYAEIDKNNLEHINQTPHPEITYRDENFDTVYVLPNDEYSGECSNNVVVAEIYADEYFYRNGGVPEATVYVPIYMSLNTYSLKSLNAWDGNHIEINEDENYILAPQIGAGEKDKENRFTGLVMGKSTFYDLTRTSDGAIDDKQKQGNLEPVKSIGLVGYSKGKQSVFIDAETGSATFGLQEGNNEQGPNKTLTNGLQQYSEGRIQLVPGGTSSIGNWKIGSRSLYNVVKDYRTTTDPARDIKMMKPYEDLATATELDGVKGSYRYSISVPHDAGGIMLSAKPSYVSVKGRMFENTSSYDGINPNYMDANVIVQPYDSFEIEMNPNIKSLFTVYRHTLQPAYTYYDVNNYGIYLNGVRYSRPITDSTNGQVIGWHPLIPAIDYNGRKIRVDNKDTYLVARPYLQDESLWFCQLVTDQKDYYIPERLRDESAALAANRDIFTHGAWHREAKVGINHQGRFYTNALRDRTTALNIGYIGAYGKTATAEYYVGASFETGINDLRTNKLIKFFTRKSEIETDDSTLYVTAGSTPRDEYPRKLVTAFQDYSFYASNGRSTQEETDDRIILSNKEISLRHKDTHLYLPGGSDKTKQSELFTYGNLKIWNRQSQSIANFTKEYYIYAGKGHDSDGQVDTQSDSATNNQGLIKLWSSQTLDGSLGRTYKMLIRDGHGTYDMQLGEGGDRKGLIHIDYGSIGLNHNGDRTADAGLALRYNNSGYDGATLWGTMIKIEAGGKDHNWNGGVTISSHSDADGIKLEGVGNSGNLGAYLHLIPGSGGNGTVFLNGQNNGDIQIIPNTDVGNNGVQITPLASIQSLWVYGQLRSHGGTPGDSLGIASNASISTSNKVFAKNNVQANDYEFWDTPFWQNYGAHQNVRGHLEEIYNELRKLRNDVEDLKKHLNTLRDNYNQHQHKFSWTGATKVSVTIKGGSVDPKIGEAVTDVNWDGTTTYFEAGKDGSATISIYHIGSGRSTTKDSFVKSVGYTTPTADTTNGNITVSGTTTDMNRSVSW